MPPGRPSSGWASSDEYDLSIDVFAMAYQPPQAKAQAITGFVQNVYAPMAQAFQQQGGQLNLQVLVDTLAELQNMPRLKQLVQFIEPQQPAQGPGGGDDVATPATTTRNYVRRDSPSPGASAQAGIPNGPTLRPNGKGRTDRPEQGDADRQRGVTNGGCVV